MRGVKRGGGSEKGADASLSCRGDIINSLTFRFSDIIGCLLIGERNCEGEWAFWREGKGVTCAV